MVRCCGKAPQDAEPEIQREMRFPMWVISIRCFLAMAAGPPPCHQELIAQGKLTQWTAGMFCLFVSHQWLGLQHPDPTGQQTETLRSALRSILSGSVKVCSDLVTSLVFGQTTELSQEHCGKLKDAWLWLDWMSIPQLTMQKPGEAPEMGKQVEDAIWSIPAYASHSDIFLVLCPSLKHADTGEMCSRQTWGTRGWCRLEVAAAMMGSVKKKPYVVVTSPSIVFMEESKLYFHDRVGRGVFTDPGDKQKIFPVMKDIIDKYAEFLWQEGTSKIHHARFYTTMRSNFLEGLVPEEAEEPEEGMASFLEKLHFGSPMSPAKGGFGPLHCAAMAGNCRVIRELVAAKADVNQRMTSVNAKDMNDMSMIPGSSPFLYTMWSARGREAAKLLLELRADLHIRSKINTDALVHAASTGNLSLTEYLLDLGMDPEVQSHIGPVLHVVAMTGQTETMRLLLERGVRCESRNLFGWTPLITAALFGQQDSCQILVEHGADAQAKVIPPALTGEVVFGVLGVARLFISKNSPLAVLGSTRSQTAATIAQALGHLEVVRLLERAQMEPLAPSGCLSLSI